MRSPIAVVIAVRARQARFSLASGALRARYWAWDNRFSRLTFAALICATLALLMNASSLWFKLHSHKPTSLAAAIVSVVMMLFIVPRSFKNFRMARQAGVATPEKAALEAKIEKLRGHLLAEREAVALQEIFAETTARSDAEGRAPAAGADAARKPKRL
jgi:membrane protein insertase Oxa1/YidC/SpoIIIJ